MGAVILISVIYQCTSWCVSTGDGIKIGFLSTEVVAILFV